MRGTRWPTCSPADGAAACSSSTDRRAKPAVYFGGKPRIIDFALSNALNSGIRRIAVASLIRHLQRGWNFLRPERNESFDVLPAYQRVSETMWYLGTADAVYQNIHIIESYCPHFLVLLADDHVYKMDYEMLQQHIDSGADVTAGCLERRSRKPRRLKWLQCRQCQTGRRREGKSKKKKTKPMERSTREPLPLRLAPRCLARTRSGTPGQKPVAKGKKRCRLHGGR